MFDVSSKSDPLSIFLEKGIKIAFFMRFMFYLLKKYLMIDAFLSEEKQ